MMRRLMARRLAAGRHVRVFAAALVPTLVVLSCLLSGASGCGSMAVHAPGCTVDMQCPTGNVCMVGICLPRGMDRTVAVEILPSTVSSAARTGIASVALGPGQIALAADERVMVDGTVTNAPNAHVVLLVPSPIPGQPDLQFETDLADFKFQIGVGSRLLHSMATLWTIPQVEDQQQPPVPFKTMLDSSLSFTFPTVGQMTLIRGVLRDSLNMPPPVFLARALVDNKVVSNVAPTDAAGMYQLLIAPGAVPDNTQLVTIDFTPVVPDSGPRFQAPPVQLAVAANSATPPTLRMPAFLSPTSQHFMVQSSDKGASPISDVTMRFRTQIVEDPTAVAGSPTTLGASAVAIYEREVRTDAYGGVDVPLIPGAANQPRNYQLTIVPPPDSPYATKCIAQLPVTIVGSDAQPPNSNTFYLDPKVTLQGTVLASDASAAATVSVTATPLTVSADCPSPTSASPISATTMSTGYYQMLVDPGTYRLEIDPPVGSPVPRLTEEGNAAVVVTTDSVTVHDVMLPPGEVIEGNVKGFDDMPLGSASLKIFEVLCHAQTCEGSARIPPALRAQTRTDMSGHFRAVLPLP